MTMMSNPSSQTFTILFTDLESSTQLWEQHPEAMKDALERHGASRRVLVARTEDHLLPFN